MKWYDPNKPSKYVTYLDANNLYYQAMSKYLPYGGFERLSKKEIDIFDVKSISENSSDGYILEVDLEYSDELHYLHNDYPLAAKNLKLIIICCHINICLQTNME